MIDAIQYCLQHQKEVAVAARLFDGVNVMELTARLEACHAAGITAADCSEDDNAALYAAAYAKSVLPRKPKGKVRVLYTSTMTAAHSSAQWLIHAAHPLSAPTRNDVGQHQLPRCQKSRRTRNWAEYVQSMPRTSLCPHLCRGLCAIPTTM